MEVTVNDKVYDVPFDIADITLGKYVEYYEMFGRELDQRLAEIQKKDYKKELAEQYDEPSETDIELHQQMDFDDHLNNEALAWYSFFTGSDMFELRDQPLILPLLEQYRLLRFLLKETLDEAQELPMNIIWNQEEWRLDTYLVTPASEMTFNEIITAKEVMRQIYKISKGRWDGLPYLCAIYFRRKGERFTDEFIHEGSDRLNLMKTLPLSHALRVAFFLTNCAAIWNRTLAYSEREDQEIAKQN